MGLQKMFKDGFFGGPDLLILGCPFPAPREGTGSYTYLPLNNSLGAGTHEPRLHSESLPYGCYTEHVWSLNECKIIPLQTESYADTLYLSTW